MPKKVWVQGPIALDTVVYVSEFPTPGSFVNSLRTGKELVALLQTSHSVFAQLLLTLGL